MSKDKEEGTEQPKTPSFAGFSILRGEFIPPTDSTPAEPGSSEEEEDEVEDTTKVGKPTETKEEKPAEAEEVTEQAEEEQEEVDLSAFKVFAKSLAEKGVLDFDDTDEEFEESEQGIEKLVDKTVKNRIDKWAKSLPDDYVSFLEYVQAGGKPKDFVDIYYNKQSWENFEIDTEDNQKAAVRESLKLSGESEEDIDEMVEEWYDNGTLEKRAKSAINKLRKHEEAEKLNLLEQQKDLQKRREQEAQKYWEDFKKDVYNRSDINGFKLTDKTKDKLWEFMSSTDKKTGKTPYQKAVEENKDSSLLFAYLAMNNFDISKLESQVATKVSKDLGKALKNYKDSKDKISSGRTNDNYSTNPFEAFKTIKA